MDCIDLKIDHSSLIVLNTLPPVHCISVMGLRRRSCEKELGAYGMEHGVKGMEYRILRR